MGVGAIEQLIMMMKSDADKTYDFVSNNYSAISKEEFVDVVKELLYAVCKYDNSKTAQKEILSRAADELAERYGLSCGL